MPTPQGMFENTFNNSDAYSKSDSQRLSLAYPRSPIHSSVGTAIETFTRDGVKSYYQDNVLDGSFPSESDFTQSDYDYNSAPEIPEDLVAPVPLTEGGSTFGETKAGETGSTIAAGGKGPNVATINLANLATTSNVNANQPSSPPGSGLGSNTSPKGSSAKIGVTEVDVPTKGDAKSTK